MTNRLFLVHSKAPVQIASEGEESRNSYANPILASCEARRFRKNFMTVLMWGLYLHSSYRQRHLLSIACLLQNYIG